MLYANHIINPEYSTLTSKQLQALWAETIDQPLRDRYLLSESVKVLKGQKYGYLTGVCYMSNATTIGGINTCSHAKKAGCIEPCLAMSGHMAGREAIQARADRLKLLIKNPSLFFEVLRRELKRLQGRADRHGYKVAGRLNGTTDLDWTRITFDGLTIFEHFKGLEWYDYTKNPTIAQNYSARGVSITFSYYKKADTQEVLDLIDRGVNVAIAYRDKLPEVQTIGDRSVPVINGDEHDLRFLDRHGVIVGLKYKNQTMHAKAREVNARAHNSGFILFSGEVVA